MNKMTMKWVVSIKSKKCQYLLHLALHLLQVHLHLNSSQVDLRIDLRREANLSYQEHTVEVDRSQRNNDLFLKRKMGRKYDPYMNI